MVKKRYGIRRGGIVMKSFNLELWVTSFRFMVKSIPGPILFSGVYDQPSHSEKSDDPL